MSYQATSPLTTTDLPASKESLLSSFGRGLLKLNDWFMKRAVLRELRRLDSRMLRARPSGPPLRSSNASGSGRDKLGDRARPLPPRGARTGIASARRAGQVFPSKTVMARSIALEPDAEIH